MAPILNPCPENPFSTNTVLAHYDSYELFSVFVQTQKEIMVLYETFNRTIIQILLWRPLCPSLMRPCYPELIVDGSSYEPWCTLLTSTLSTLISYLHSPNQQKAGPHRSTGPFRKNTGTQSSAGPGPRISSGAASKPCVGGFQLGSSRDRLQVVDQSMVRTRGVGQSLTTK